jgi:hypothetical protein
VDERDHGAFKHWVEFTGRYKYTIVPRKWTYRFSLGMIERWRDLHSVVQFAQERRGYGDTDSGVGIEYPVRPERRDEIRIWRWVWRVKGKIHTRKYHFPEADYLATLAALLRVKGWDEDAKKIAAIRPLPQVDILPVPDPYDFSNYSFSRWIPDIMDVLRLIVEQESYALAMERAATRQGFVVADGSGVAYLPDGSLELRLAHGRKKMVAEADYLRLLHEAHASATNACRKLDEAMAEWRSKRAAS